jgi:hypothetical protein
MMEGRYPDKRGFGGVSNIPYRVANTTWRVKLANLTREVFPT